MLTFAVIMFDDIESKPDRYGSLDLAPANFHCDGSHVRNPSLSAKGPETGCLPSFAVTVADDMESKRRY